MITALWCGDSNIHARILVSLVHSWACKVCISNKILRGSAARPFLIEPLVLKHALQCLDRLIISDCKNPQVTSSKGASNSGLKSYEYGGSDRAPSRTKQDKQLKKYFHGDSSLDITTSAPTEGLSVHPCIIHLKHLLCQHRVHTVLHFGQGRTARISGIGLTVMRHLHMTEQRPARVKSKASQQFFR